MIKIFPLNQNYIFLDKLKLAVSEHEYVFQTKSQ